MKIILKRSFGNIGDITIECTQEELKKNFKIIQKLYTEGLK